MPFLCLLVSGSYSKNQLSSPVLTRLRKSSSVSGRSSISADTLFWHTFQSSFKFFGTITAHTFLMFKSCATIWWTVHSLILSSYAIIQIAKCRSWRMKALTWPMFVLVLTEAGRPDRGPTSTISRPFTKT
jgi:hypothetical protein